MKLYVREGLNISELLVRIISFLLIIILFIMMLESLMLLYKDVFAHKNADRTEIIFGMDSLRIYSIIITSILLALHTYYFFRRKGISIGYNLLLTLITATVLGAGFVIPLMCGDIIWLEEKEYNQIRV